jgi:beta-alanine degradation protein BauB
MARPPLVAALCIMIAGRTSLAQEPPAPVPLTAEPSHHKVLENDEIRLFTVEVAPGATTRWHEHANDFIWIALGDAVIVDHPRDGADARVEARDGAMTFRPRGLVHAVTNQRDVPFRNVTIELLRAQTGGRNQCGSALKDRPLDCPASAGASSPKRKGPSVLPEFETDQTIVSLVTLGPDDRFAFKPTMHPPVLVALEGTDAEALVDMKMEGGAYGRGKRAMKGGDAMAVPTGMGVELHNLARAPARFVVLEFRGQ